MPKRKRDEEDKLDELARKRPLQTLFSPISNAYHWASDAFDAFKMRQYLSINHAIQEGNLPAVRGFLKNGVDVTEKTPSMEHTPLHQAAAKGRIEIIRFLIDQGANVNVQNAIAATPLHMAAGSGHIEVVHLLIKEGAYINAQSRMGVPLSWAASRGRFDVVRLLLEHGANPNGAENDARPPIVVAAENGYPRIVNLLQQHGAILPEHLQINGAINNGQSVHTVSVHESVSKSALILQNHYQLNAQDIAKAHRELAAFVDKLPALNFKSDAAKRGLARLNTLDFIDERSGVSLHEAMALVWKSLTVEKELIRKRKERGLSEQEEPLLRNEEEEADLKEAITDWLYQAQRNYNVSESGIDNQGADSSSCTSGCFNISLYALNGRHPLVNIPVVNEAYIAAQIPILANQAFDDLTPEERAEYVKASRDEISPALLTRLRQLIEPALHEKFDEFQSDGLNVNKIIQDALETIEYVRIIRLEDSRGKQEQEDESPVASASSSSNEPPSPYPSPKIPS